MPFQSTTQLRYLPDLKGDILELVPSQYRDKDRIRALLHGLAHGTQIAEDDAFRTLIAFVLDTAVGDQLERWGNIVGEPRGSLPDDDYRRFISARMLANRSNGKRDELLKILSIITAPSDCFIRDLHPPGFELWFVHEEALDARLENRVSRFMSEIKPAGHPMVLVEAVTGYFGGALDPWALGFGEGLFARTI